MNDRTYQWITHSCALVAVLSAILFDQLGQFSWLALAVGIAAAATAASLYFYRSWESNVSSEGDLVESSESPELSLAKIEWRYSSASSQRRALVRILCNAESEYTRTSHPSDYDQQLGYWFVVPTSQQEKIGQRMVDALSPFLPPTTRREIEMECVMTRRGEYVFVVRPVNRFKRARLPVDVYPLTSEKTSSGEWKVAHKLRDAVLPPYTPSGSHEAVY